MELLILKILILSVSGISRLFFGLIPILLFKLLRLNPDKNKVVKKIISLLMFFGGGVLIATCFLHMMPHVRESFDQANLNTNLPVSEIVFIIGFFMVYMLEDIVHGFIHKRRKHKHHAKQNAANQHAMNQKHCNGNNVVGVQNLAFDGQQNSQITATIIPRIKSPLESQSINSKGNTPKELNHANSIPSVHVITPGGTTGNNNNNNSSKTLDGGVVASNFKYVDPDWYGNSQLNLLTNSTFTVRSNSLYDIPLSTPVSGRNGQIPGAGPDGAHKIQPIEYDTGSSSSGTFSSAEEESAEAHPHQHHHHHHEHSHIPPVDDTDDSLAGAIRNLLIVVAISFHGIFEGMAIGLQPTQKDVLYLFLAVSLHECTIIFCIGIELISSKSKILRMLLYILIVSLVGPIGMSIGIVVSEVQGSSGQVGHVILIGSLQGFAAGTLLYVAFFEIFVAEGKHLKRKYIHIIVAIIGFIFMGALELIGGHSHGGGGGSGGHGHSHGAPSSTSAATLGNSSVTLDNHSDHSHEDHDHDHEHDHDHNH